MQPTSIVAVYFLLWFFSLFLVLPFRLRHSREEEDVPGQAESAPPQFSMLRTALWTTVVSAALLALFWANYVEGWVTPDMLDFFTPPNMH